MERTYERRRGASSAGRAGRRAQPALEAREKRRLAQLGVSAGLFLSVFFGRGLLDAGQLAAWKPLLTQDTDFSGAFSQFGEALSRGEPMVDALGELWVEVFAGEQVSAGTSVAVWDSLPPFSRRMAAQLADPGDPVGRWTAEVRAGTMARDAQTGGDGGSPGLAGTAATAGMLVLRPLAATAQAADGEGRALPGRVSLEYYDLGLKGTVLPVSAPLTSGFGFREGPLEGGEDFHLGVDLGAELGADILAFADGVVAFAGENRTYGEYVKLEHKSGVTTVYAHCQKLLVKQGQRVSAGQTIARVGQTGDATGPHLHFSVLKNDIFLDPLYYIAPQG